MRMRIMNTLIKRIRIRRISEVRNETGKHY
jgi:hypothetical protein